MNLDKKQREKWHFSAEDEMEVCADDRQIPEKPYLARGPKNARQWGQNFSSLHTESHTSFFTHLLYTEAPTTTLTVSIWEQIATQGDWGEIPGGKKA